MSVSSLEGSPVPLDLPAKYQKLAAEYAKIRAQLGVLKKAVVDEQNQIAELKEILKVKDQNLRKAEQELDSLNFRNQQLTKRVTILQDELDSLQNSSKSSKSKSSNKEIKTAVIVEELQKKIAENASLISTLQEQTEKYENEKFKLNQKIEIHEHKIKEYQMNLSLIEGTKLAKYESENKLLLSKLNSREEEIKKLNVEMKKLKCDLVGRNAALNNSSFKENFSKLMQSLALQDLFTSLSQFFQQLEFRYNKHMEDKHFQKFLEINQRNRLFLQDFVDKYLLYSNEGDEQDVLLGIENLFDNIENYTLVLQDLSECLDFSKDEEVILTIKAIIFNFKKHWTEFNSALKKSQTPDLTPLECEDLIRKLIDVFRSFRGTCDYFLSAFNEKFKSTSINKESEKEILELLYKMSLQSSAVYKKLTESSAVLMQALEYRLIKIKQKTVLSQSDQCCEHWKQEFEVLKATHVKKIRDLEEQISCLSEATTPRSTNSGLAVQSPFEEKKEVEDRFNECETGNPGDISVVGEEAEIIKFFNARANKLVAERQYAESRVTVLKEECENLQRRLEHSLESRLILEDSIKKAQNTVSKLQEELQTTTINYEIQLQSMSEHMANMNEKFASQEEQIEILKHQLTGKHSEQSEIWKGTTKIVNEDKFLRHCEYSPMPLQKYSIGHVNSLNDAYLSPGCT